MKILYMKILFIIILFILLLQIFNSFLGTDPFQSTRKNSINTLLESFNDKKYYIGKSKIHGHGVLANKNFKKYDVIELAFIEKNNYADITPYFGKFINHCDKPNMVLKRNGDKYYTVALKNIKKNEELLLNYYDTPDYIIKPEPHYKC